MNWIFAQLRRHLACTFIFLVSTKCVTKLSFVVVVVLIIVVVVIIYFCCCSTSFLFNVFFSSILFTFPMCTCLTVRSIDLCEKQISFFDLTNEISTFFMSSFVVKCLSLFYIFPLYPTNTLAHIDRPTDKINPTQRCQVKITPHNVCWGLFFFRQTNAKKNCMKSHTAQKIK